MMVSDPKRIERRLKVIAACTEESGKITRRTFSKAWEEAVTYVCGEMEDAGMTVRMDTFGNLIGVMIRRIPIRNRSVSVRILTV